MSSTTGPLAQQAAYEDLFERMGDSALLVDVDTYVIREVNPACERVLGYEAEKLLGTSLLDLACEEQRNDFEKALRISRRRHYARQVELKWKTQADKIIHMEVIVCVLKLADDREIFQVVAKDITRQREAEQQARIYLDELKSANAKLEELSITDEMTGIYNYRYFSKLLREEHARAERFPAPYSIIFCDVDHFKVYNDKNGHPAGDQVLKHVSALLQQHIRKTDRCARYGGEEFIVLCPGVTWEGAHTLAERLRAAVEHYPFEFAKTQPLGRVTISVGVSCFPLDGKTAEDVVKAADQALYESKHIGRNRVTSYFEMKSLAAQITRKKQAA